MKRGLPCTAMDWRASQRTAGVYRVPMNLVGLLGKTREAVDRILRTWRTMDPSCSQNLVCGIRVVIDSALQVHC